MIARFEPTEMTPVFNSFMNVVGLVALVSVLGAIALGVYISGRARREIDNLVDAFTRVAAGDLSTAVMAYEEGEFAQLADSFSEMMQKLRDSQNKLATSEKIAAWQTMARKIAHEIKNPLTPIGISVDDLRRSHQQKLPHFDQTVESSTRMIRSEVDRLCRLLDQFVSFARMSPPVISEISTDELLHDLEMLYAAEIESGTLAITVQTGRTTVRVDPAQIKQVLVNLIKNSLEAAEGATVEVAAADSPESLRLSVFDNGPGFSEHVLGHSFEPYVSSKKDGSGLGLVICQRIVHDHGGTIQLSNKPEGGAAVIILLPQN